MLDDEKSGISASKNKDSGSGNTNSSHSIDQCVPVLRICEVWSDVVWRGKRSLILPDEQGQHLVQRMKAEFVRALTEAQ